jgi:hypothetical protein
MVSAAARDAERPAAPPYSRPAMNILACDDGWQIFLPPLATARWQARRDCKKRQY